MIKSVAGLVAFVVLAASGTSRSEASYLPFSGSGTSGTLPGDLPWTYPGFSTSYGYAWGSPGLGFGNATFQAPGPETELTVTFTGLPTGVTITPVLTDTSTFTSTRFYDSTTGVFWSGTVSNNGATVTFFAPAGSPLSAGDSIFFNVVFSGNAGPSVTFSGAFDPQLAPSVPEPASMVMVGTSVVAGLGSWLRRRRKAGLAA